MSNLEHYTSREFPSETLVPGMGGSFEPELMIDAAHDGGFVPQTSWDRVALRHIEAHLQRETSVVNGYEAMVGTTTGAIEYLLNQVISDEYRHHHVLAELAKAVGSATGRPEYEASEVPVPGPIEEETRRQLLGETRRFIDVENEDDKDLKQLVADLRPAKSRTIWPLLVELMQLDTEKHLKILRRIEQLLTS